jgi:putative ABC transport system permease protein
MYIRDTLSLAFESLTINKLRSFLTILGITIGTAAILSGITLGIGNRNALIQKLAGLGLNQIWFYVKIEEKGIPFAPGELTYRPLSFTEEDVSYVKRECPDIVAVCPILITPVLLRYGGESNTIKATGWMRPSDGHQIYKPKLIAGKFFSDLDQKQRERVCVIEESDFSREIFNGDFPVGKYIDINHSRFKVVGLISKLIWAFGYPERQLIIFPASSLQEVTGIQGFSEVENQVNLVTNVPRTTGILRESLAKRFGNSPSFTVNDWAAGIKVEFEALDIITFSLICLAFISLAVSGIGIMNIMSASVIERTREVGVIKAIGARNKEVLFLFLIEALFLSVVGGSMGVYLSLFITKLISVFIGFEYSVSFWSIALCFLLSNVIGITSGIVPARRAARLEPAEALRFG